MTGANALADAGRLWWCRVDCGGLAFSCPCAVADNLLTGQSDDVGWHNHDDAVNPL